MTKILDFRLNDSDYESLQCQNHRCFENGLYRITVHVEVVENNILNRFLRWDQFRRFSPNFRIDIELEGDVGRVGDYLGCSLSRERREEGREVWIGYM